MDHLKDLERRERKNARGRAYREAHGAELNARRRQRYATDPEFRAKSLAKCASSFSLVNGAASLSLISD